MRSQSTPQAPSSSTRSVHRKPAASLAAKPRRSAKTATAAHPDGPGSGEPVEAPDPGPGPALLEGPTREALIRLRAYERYERNGCVDGKELDDWLAAEAEVGALMTGGGEDAAAAGA